jgi:AraC-like DNA-binding protein
MLCYLGSGSRDYGVNPVPIYRRPYWEFQAVISGAISPTTPGLTQELSGKKLWVFPPGHYHGWRGKPHLESEVCVFHFTVVPEAVETVVRKTGTIEVDLSDDECLTLRNLNNRLRDEIRNPHALTPLRYNKALHEISLLALEKVPPGHLEFSRFRDRQVVESAVAWYLSNMENRIGVGHVSAEMGISESHLRRLFKNVLGRSPQEIFHDRQLERACDLLDCSDLNVTEVAVRCGFSGQSVFSRAFTRRFGMSPRSWKQSSTARENSTLENPVVVRDHPRQWE